MASPHLPDESKGIYIYVFFQGQRDLDPEICSYIVSPKCFLGPSPSTLRGRLNPSEMDRFPQKRSYTPRA